jgi:carbonic anhydrase
MAVLQYAVEHLQVEHGKFTSIPRADRSINEPSVVVVVGHSKCGGVTAALVAAQADSDPSITIQDHPASSPLNRWLAPLTDFALRLKPQISSMSQEDALQFLVEQNVKAQVDSIANSEVMEVTWKRETEESGRKVRVHGWVYDLGSGLLKDLETTRGPST